MKRFIGYYKWHLLFLLLVIICVAFVLFNMTTTVSPDMTIAYADIRYIDTQMFNDNKHAWEHWLQDSNGDDKKVANLIAYNADLQRDIDELFVKLVDEDTNDIYIMSKTTFENFEDKSVFFDVRSYAEINEERNDFLKDEDGKIYAVSLEDNKFAKDLGIIDTTDLYIAVCESKEDEIPTERKNGRNIASTIINRENN